MGSLVGRLIEYVNYNLIIPYLASVTSILSTLHELNYPFLLYSQGSGFWEVIYIHCPVSPKVGYERRESESMICDVNQEMWPITGAAGYIFKDNYSLNE